MTDKTQIELLDKDVAIVFSDGETNLHFPKQADEDEIAISSLQALRCAVFLQQPDLVEKVDSLIGTLKPDRADK